MRISDWSSDVCSSDLPAQCDDAQGRWSVGRSRYRGAGPDLYPDHRGYVLGIILTHPAQKIGFRHRPGDQIALQYVCAHHAQHLGLKRIFHRSEEHTSELQSLMRISYAVFCLKKKKK